MKITIELTPDEWAQLPQLHNIASMAEPPTRPGTPSMSVNDFLMLRTGKNRAQKRYDTIQWIDDLKAAGIDLHPVPSKSKKSSDGCGDQLRLYDPTSEEGKTDFAFAVISVKTTRTVFRLYVNNTIAEANEELLHRPGVRYKSYFDNWSVSIDNLSTPEHRATAVELAKIAKVNLTNQDMVWWKLDKAS